VILKVTLDLQSRGGSTCQSAGVADLGAVHAGVGEQNPHCLDLLFGVVDHHLPA
jgi:hypothetical protein